MIHKLKKISIQLLFILALLNSAVYGQILNEEVLKYAKALHALDNYYIDTVDKGKLTEKALIGMLKELDPHTSYLTPEEVKEMNEPLEGNFEGIGIQFNIYKDTIYVISPVTGGPSEKVGIQAGDRIVRIEGENVAGIGISTNGVRDRLLGEKGTKVNVTIKRPGVKKLLHFTITRDKIPIHSLDAAYMADKNTGYIKLNRFSLTTNDEFTEAVKELKEEGANSFILDLRGNSGGYLDQAIKLADEFLSERKLIVYTEGKSIKRQDNYATSSGVCKDNNVVVLIDEGSASASEIVAGALQDWDKGIIVGRRSFGKGLVQRPVNLPDGSMIRLTIARYHTPTGRVIQKPYNNGHKEYEKELLKRFDHGEMVSADSIEFPDSLKYYTKKNERVVYGGGGIMPDIFIPLDTTSYSKYFNDLIRLGVINSYILKYIDEKREVLQKKYPTIESYIKNFRVTEEMMNNMAEMAEEKNIKKEKDDLVDSSEEIKTQLKALIARDFWDMTEYFQIVNKKDKEFQKSMEVLNNWEEYRNRYLMK